PTRFGPGTHTFWDSRFRDRPLHGITRRIATRFTKQERRWPCSPWRPRRGGCSCTRWRDLIQKRCVRISAFAIVYSGDPASLSEEVRERELAPRSRKPIREFVMTGRWGHTAPLLKE